MISDENIETEPEKTPKVEKIEKINNTHEIQN
jgi:hypothetical protein